MAEHLSTPSAMVVGKSGTGKSTLCNYLLYGIPRPEGGFTARSGVGSVTLACQTKEVQSTIPPPRFGLTPGGPLKVVDTPGIPDPAGRTLEFYDEIVRAARQTGGLNALIMTVNYSDDRDQIKHDFDTYRILMTQFEKLPAHKFIVCRVRLQPDITWEQQHADMVPVKEWVNDIKDKGGMRSASVVYLVDNDMQLPQLFKLRQVVTEMPRAPIEDWNLQTFAELKGKAQRLTDLNRRTEELQDKRRVLGLEREQLGQLNTDLRAKAENVCMHGNILSGIMIAGGMLMDVCMLEASGGTFAAVGAAAARTVELTTTNYAEWHRAKIVANTERQIAIDEEVTEIHREVDGGAPSRRVLERDRDELDQLELLARATATPAPSS